jgi:hypothetical protein
VQLQWSWHPESCSVNLHAIKTVLLHQLDGAGNTCLVSLTAPRLMRAPVFLYYELDNFYQNHRRCPSPRDGSVTRQDHSEGRN